MVLKIVVFGEAEKGSFEAFHKINTLDSLYQTLGEPPEESEGLFLAISVLLKGWGLLFFRVAEEGMATKDYLKGLSLLENGQKIGHINAIGMPKVGEGKVIDRALEICQMHKSLLILKEKDFYDYLTSESFFS